MAPPTQAALRERLERHGVQPTRQRLRVVDVLAREPHDTTAQEIHARLRAEGEPVGLATVYRTISLLSERGVVDALTHHAGETCYRLCGEGHHHHLVCGDCHRVVEIGDCSLEPWLEQISAAHDFVLTGHRVELTGLCADCVASRP